MGRKGGGGSVYCELRAGNPGDGIKLSHSQKLEPLTALTGGSTPWDPSAAEAGGWTQMGFVRTRKAFLKEGAQDRVSGNLGWLQICH